MCLLGRDFYDDVMHLFLLVIPKTPVIKGAFLFIEKALICGIFIITHFIGDGILQNIG